MKSPVTWNEFKNVKIPYMHIKVWPLLTFKRWGIGIIKLEGSAQERYERDHP